jgi:hypothetical protein
MGKPTLLVLTLLVLWLIVLVPMIFRRVDDGAQVRSVRRYGRSMRLLNRRHAHTTMAMAAGGSGFGRTRYDSVVDEVRYVTPRVQGPRDELFVPGAGRRRVEVGGGPGPARGTVEGPMKDRSEMSDARREMMARRRRSLTILIAGSIISLLLALAVGGVLFALAATAFCLGLGGYVYFLRTQALRDRDRKAWREDRTPERIVHHHETVTEDEYFDEIPATMVRIDDDHIDLHNLDTIDLTGIAEEIGYRDLRERKAS